MRRAPGRPALRRKGCSAVVLGLAVCLAGSASAAGLRVEVEGIEPGGGPVRVALCQGGLTEAACGQGDEAPATGTRARFAFAGVAPGLYAVAVFQDANGNGRLDRSPLGLPLEPYGFSGEVGRRARPDFSQAAFTLSEPGTAIRVRLARALPGR